MTGVLSVCSVALLLTQLHLGSASGECQSAVQAVTSASNSQTAATVVYQSLNDSSRGLCGLRSTCCSSQAEQMLKTASVHRYQSLLNNKMSMNILPCLNNNSVAAESARYIQQWKSEVIDLLNLFSQFNTPTLLDDFANFLSNGILSLNLPNFQQELQKVFFEIYLRSFKITMETSAGLRVPSTVAFTQCFYTNMFVPDNQNRLNQRYRVMHPRLNFLFRFLLAIKTSDSVLNTIKNRVLSPECGDALLRLTHCKECSGISSSSPPCTPFCQNVLRGCLVDLTEVGEVLQEYATALEAMRNKLRTDNPFQAVDLLSSTVLDVVDSGRTVVSRRTTIETTCNVQFSSTRRRRRTVSNPLPHIQRRSTARAEPFTVMGSAIECAKNVAQFVRSLPEQLCGNVSSTANCWNGMDIGNYSKDVPAADRRSQVNNSELLVIRPNTGLVYRDAIAQLKNISTELSHCASSQLCPARIVSLSIPSPSDFTLTGAKYENITRAVVPVPVSSTLVRPTSTVLLLTSSVATSSHTTSHVPTSSTTTTHSVPTSESPLTLTHLPLSATPSSQPSTSHVVGSSSSFVSKLSAFFTESSSLKPSSTYVGELSSPVNTDFFTSAVAVTPTPSTTLTPHGTQLLTSLLSSSSASSIVESNDIPATTFSHLTSTPLPVTTQVIEPLSSPSSSSSQAVNVTHLSSRPSPSNTVAAGPTSGISGIVSGLLLGVGGIGWLLLAISLLVNIALVAVLVKRRSHSLITSDSWSPTKSQPVGPGVKVFPENSKHCENANGYVHKMYKNGRPVYTANSILYPPKSSSIYNYDITTV